MRTFIICIISLVTELGAALVLWAFGGLFTYIVNTSAGTAIPYLPYWAYMVVVFAIIVIADLVRLNAMNTDALLHMRAADRLARTLGHRMETDTAAIDDDDNDDDNE